MSFKETSGLANYAKEKTTGKRSVKRYGLVRKIPAIEKDFETRMEKLFTPNWWPNFRVNWMANFRQDPNRCIAALQSVEREIREGKTFKHIGVAMHDTWRAMQ